MTFYRFGQQIMMTRAVTRAMSRSSTRRQSSATIEKLMQASKSRFGSAVKRPLGAAVATFLDSGVAFNSSSMFLYFDGEDDDGTFAYVQQCIREKLVSVGHQDSIIFILVDQVNMHKPNHRLKQNTGWT